MENWQTELAKKKDNELDEFIDEFKDSYTDVLEALVKELKKRDYRVNLLPPIEKEINDRKVLQKAVEETNIKTEASFKWTPEFTSELETDLPRKIVFSTIGRAMIALGWYVVHLEDNAIEAKRPNDWGDPTEKITVSLNNKTLKISSKSIKNNLYDFGKNSKRVEEFKISFKMIESGYDENKIADEIKEIAHRDEKNKYQIPEELTKPIGHIEKNINYLIGGSFLLSIGIGSILAILASFIYIIFLYDFLVGLVTLVVFGYLIKLSNISDFKVLRTVGFLSIGLSYFLSQLFRFMYIVSQNSITDASIIDYFYAKLEHGLKYKDSNFGMIGLIIAWVIEITIALLFYYSKIAPKVIKFDLERAPEDVVDFAIYWFNEGKDESAVRKELYKIGWFEKEQQDIIINAVGARYAIHQVQRS